MKFKDAANEFCKLINVHPEEIQIVTNRMAGYLTKPDASEQTIEVVKEFQASKNQFEYYQLLSFIYQIIGKYEDAFRTVIESNDKFKKDGTSIFVYGEETYRNRNFKQAAEALNYLINNFRFVNNLLDDF